MGGSWLFLSLLELRDRVQPEREKSPGSLSPPPAFPSHSSGESHACSYLGWQSPRAGTERKRGSFIYTVRRRRKKKKNHAREAVKVLSVQFSIYLSASHQAAPSPACDADVLWGRQCEETKRDASVLLVQVSRQVTNCPS